MGWWQDYGSSGAGKQDTLQGLAEVWETVLKHWNFVCQRMNGSWDFIALKPSLSFIARGSSQMEVVRLATYKALIAEGRIP